MVYPICNDDVQNGEFYEGHLNNKTSMFRSRDIDIESSKHNKTHASEPVPRFWSTEVDLLGVVQLICRQTRAKIN